MSRALLRQRAIAIETGATMPVRLRVAPPDSARAAALAGRIADIRRQQEERRARLVEYPVGVVRARLEAAVATLVGTLATLQHERMKAFFGFACDPMLPEHQWIRAMKLEDMRWSFRVDRILYQDGTRREFELES